MQTITQELQQPPSTARLLAQQQAEAARGMALRVYTLAGANADVDGAVDVLYQVYNNTLRRINLELAQETALACTHISQRGY